MPFFRRSSGQPLQNTACAKLPGQANVGNKKPEEPARKMDHGWKLPKLEKYGTSEKLENLQYYTSQGNIPIQIAQDTVRNAPSPPPLDYRPKASDPKTYPGRCGNREGKAVPRSNFDTRFEIGQVLGDLVEYPVTDSRVPSYDYSKPSSRYKEVKEYKESSRADRMKKATPNVPGAYRAVTSRDKQLQGLILHLEGDRSGNHRAYVGPLDKDGREQKQHHQKKKIFRVGTWK